MAIPQWTIADRLRKARLTAGLDQSQLATELGAARNTVNNYENGHTRPKPYLVKEWAVLTHVPVEWLLNGDVWAPSDSNRQPTVYTTTQNDWEVAA